MNGNTITDTHSVQTIAGVRSALRSGATTAADLARTYLARIAAEDGPSGRDIHSVLAVTADRALAQAERIDRQIAAGEDLPPLAGVPVGVKDVLAVQGAPATAGSRILSGYHPPYDATAVARLERAGAVLVAKVNCDEFAMGSSPLLRRSTGWGPSRTQSRMPHRSSAC